MKKLKAMPFIFLGSIVHIALGFMAMGTYLRCDIQPGCVPPITKTLTKILGFPLNLVSWIWTAPNGSISDLGVVLFFLNSVLAITILWLVLKAVEKISSNTVQ